jgi:hypothetical protein
MKFRIFWLTVKGIFILFYFATSATNTKRDFSTSWELVLWSYLEAIVQEHLNCNYQIDSNERGYGYTYYGEHIIGTWIRRLLWIHYWEGIITYNKIMVYIIAIYDQDEALEVENYILSTDLMSNDSNDLDYSY